MAQAFTAKDPYIARPIRPFRARTAINAEDAPARATWYAICNHAGSAVPPTLAKGLLRKRGRASWQNGTHTSPVPGSYSS